MKTHKKLLLLSLICILTFLQLCPTCTWASETANNNVTANIEVILNVDSAAMDKCIKEFHRKYPNIKVTYTRYSEYEAEIMKRIKSGNYGDVLFIPASIDSQGVQKYLEPLGTIDDYKDTYNFIENAYILDNKLYSIPSSAYLKGIIYNKEIFDKAGITRIPKSREDFLDALQMIKDRTNSVPFYTNYEMEWILNDWSFFPYIEQSGDANYRCQNFVYEKNPFLVGSNYYEAYKLLYDIVHQNLCEKEPLVSDFSELAEKLNDGEIASAVIGTWAYNLIKNSGPNKDSLAFMPYPNEINGKQYATIGIDYGYCISKKSKHKKAARLFIDFMLNESGYAIDNDRISIVKSDPLPDVYTNVKNLEVKISNSFTDESYYYYSLLTANGNPESASYIRQVIDEARKADGDYDALMTSWNNTWENSRPEDMETFDYKTLQENSFLLDDLQEDPQSFVMDNLEIEYSKTEQDYIKEKQTIKVGYLTHLAPFQYQETNADGSTSFNGLSKVICDSIQDSTDMKFEYIPFNSYKDIIEELTSGAIDIAAGVRVEDPNAEDLIFSKSYFELSNVIMKADTLELNQLDHMTEGYLKGSELNTGVSSKSEKIGYDSIEDLIHALEHKEVDFAVCNYYSAHYYIKDVNASYVAVIPLTEKASYCLAFSKNVDTRLVSICNKCIYSFPEDHIQMILTQYMDPKAESVTLKRYIAANPMQSFFIGFAFLSLICFIIFQMNKEKYINRKKHELEIKRYAALSQLTEEYVFDYDFKSDIIHFDQKFCNKFGFLQSVSLSYSMTDNAALNTFLEEFERTKNSSSMNHDSFQLLDVQNQLQWYRMTSYLITDEKQRPQHSIGKLVNVQAFEEEKAKIEKIADHDFLTSLYNRTGFERKISELYEQNANIKDFVFAVIDLDNFKSVNDSLGHLGGDQALKKLGSELRIIASEQIICSRYGGDEFVICMLDISKEEADSIFARLASNMNHEIEFDGKRHTLSISLGAVHSNERKTTKELFECADQVLYHVKQKGKNQYLLEEYEEGN